MNHGLTTYERAQVDGLNQRDLVVMCYKGAIKYLQEARQKLEAGEVEEFSDFIEKAHRVIFHLYTTLDMQRGGEIAQGLADLYVYIINQIYLLNGTKKKEIIDGVVGILLKLKEGWEGINTSSVPRNSTTHATQPSSTRQVVSVQI